MSLFGVAVAASSGFDWETNDPDDDYESPFADEDDTSFSTDDASDLPADSNPFSSGPDDDSDAPSSATDSTPEPPADADETGLTAVADARALCDEAMDHLHAGEADRAFDRLSAHWAFSQDEMTQLQREVERTRAVVTDRYGDALDYRLVREDTAAGVLARFVYLERFNRHGLRWQFTFYEGANGWTLNDVFFDDEIEALLE